MPKKEVNVVNINKAKPMGMFFLMTYVGALVYFINQADGFWHVVFSFIQAAIWPGILIYKVFTLINL